MGHQVFHFGPFGSFHGIAWGRVEDFDLCKLSVSHQGTSWKDPYKPSLMFPLRGPPSGSFHFSFPTKRAAPVASQARDASVSAHARRISATKPLPDRALGFGLESSVNQPQFELLLRARRTMSGRPRHEEPSWATSAFYFTHPPHSPAPPSKKKRRIKQHVEMKPKGIEAVPGCPTQKTMPRPGRRGSGGRSGGNL